MGGKSLFKIYLKSFEIVVVEGSLEFIRSIRENGKSLELFMNRIRFDPIADSIKYELITAY